MGELFRAAQMDVKEQASAASGWLGWAPLLLLLCPHVALQLLHLAANRPGCAYNASRLAATLRA